ncbi:MAG: DUF2061 domain-containing protein [Flavobacteriales bacterium]|nr:DUF2061 domain-containing protein [Flavobacteriales bacterium]
MIIDTVYRSLKKDNVSTKTDKKSEAHYRSVLKSISWRIIGTMDTIFISWVITGEVNTALAIGSIEVVTKMILYYFHERTWTKIKWGVK